MSKKHLVKVDADDLEATAFRHGLLIERSADEQRIYCVLDGIEFYADSPAEVTA